MPTVETSITQPLYWNTALNVPDPVLWMDFRTGLSAKPALTITGSNGTIRNGQGNIQTTSANEARLDHDSSGVPIGILIEEARTNECIRSAAIDVSPWQVSLASVTSNQGASSDGGTNADKVDYTSNTSARLFQTTGATATSKTYTLSWYAFADSARDIRVRLDSTSSGTLNTVNYTTEVQRFTYTRTFGGGDLADVTIQFFNDATGDTTPWYIWGVQLEEGASPTSYIPTTAAAVTRAADVESTSDVTWFNSSAGTWYIRGKFGNTSTSAHALVTLDDGGTTDRFYFERDASENINFSTTHSSDTDGASEGAAVIAADTAVSILGAYADDDVQAGVDGTASAGDTSAAIPLADTMTTLRLGADSAGNYWNGHIEVVGYWPQRLETSPELFLAELTKAG